MAELKYTLIVNNGDGDGDYEESSLVNISATSPVGTHFTEWTTSDGGIIANANASITLYTMPAQNATVTSNYTADTIEITANNINVNEGASDTLHIRLSGQSAENIILNISRLSGDPDLTCSESLTFTTSNWDTPQTVSISAAEDIDTENSTAVFRISKISGINYVSDKDIIVTEGDNDTAVSGVSLDFMTLNLITGNTEQLTETIFPANASNKTVVWNSDNSQIASVDANGLVTAISEGSVNITVTSIDGNFTDICAVTINPTPVPITAISLNKTTIEMPIASTFLLSETVTPDLATDKTVFWSSDDISVVIVNSNGLVTSVAEGCATITVITKDGSLTATCDVTVIETTNLANNILKQIISIYPNPATDEVNFNNTRNVTSILIQNSLGQIVLNKSNISLGYTSINISHLERGLYYIKIFKEDYEEVIKLVKL